MIQTQLKYGRSEIPFTYDPERFAVLGHDSDAPGLADIEVGNALDMPLGSPRIEDIVGTDETVLIVVPDATRRTAAGQIVNLLVRRLIAAGTLPFNISIIFATGIHRAVTPQEKSEILTPFIFQRIKTLDHSARDLARTVRCGETSAGLPVELNRALLEHDHIFTVGGIGFHYFAGFTGGRKLICPGLASARTISATHRLAFDFDKKTRAEGCSPGRLAGNPVHEAFVEAASKVNVAFSINTIVNKAGEAAEIFCGDPIIAHEAACEHFASTRTFAIGEKYDVVIADCGGFPYDINVIQAQKSLDAAARLCKPNGTLILAAECADGTGRDDLLKWFDAADSRELTDRLAENYQVNGQTAWNILRTAKSFDVRIITELDDAACRKMRLTKFRSVTDSLADVASDAKGAIIRSAAGHLFVNSGQE
ncbi:MAG: nickel-dependent lactate racemase [Acidobacteria bacterium]|nr:nickel-dependent lactate racemase [Acidobacteriota bacterium]